MAAVALTASGCDSTGLDNTTTSPGCSTDCGSPTDPGGGNPGGGNPGGGDPQPALTFAPVSPMATYLLADPGTPYATAYRLDDYGLRPGDMACFEPVGDYFIGDGVLASGTYDLLATGAFSASDRLAVPTDRNRIKDILDGDWYINTLPLATTGAETTINEDFAASGCYPVPADAAYIFFSVYDGSYFDNTDAMVNDEPFGIRITRG